MTGFILLILSTSFQGGSHREAFADGSPEAWADFPSGFASGATGRLRMAVGDRPVVLGVSKSPAWSEDGKYEVTAAGIHLSFQKPSAVHDGFGLITALALEGTEPGEISLIVEAEFSILLSALPARFSPRGSEDVVFLEIHGGGEDAARGFYDPEADRGVDFSLIHSGFRFSSTVDGSTRRIRVEGELPRGREAALFAFKERQGIFFRQGRPQGGRGTRALESAAHFLAGVSLRGGPGLVRRAEKLLSQAPIFQGAYLEIGDGWQEKGGTKLFREPSRGWIPSQDAGRAEGAPNGKAAKETLPAVIGKIKELGFRPGLWIVPHGQSEEWVFQRSPEAFVRDPKGNPAPGGFVGRYVVDGTSPAGLAYLVDLFGKLKECGCRIFRLAGLREVVSFYEHERKSLQNPDLEPIQVLRGTLAAIREGAGGDSILVGDWNTPMELPGLLDGAVPLTMPEDGVEPLEQEGFAASRGYFRHRGAWWVECFPVARWVGEDGGDDQREWARSRVLFAALTGRGLLLDESTALFPWAQELFRAAGPTAPVRPIDLFPSPGLPRVWDLKLGDGGMGGDLVGLFNWSTLSSTAIAIHPRDLGLSWEKGKNYIYFDVFSGGYVGRSDGPMEFFLLPGRSRLVSVQRDLERPQIVAASGPYLALGSQLEDVRWDGKALELSGRAWVPGGQALGSEELRLHILCGPAFKASSASAEGGRAEVSAAGGDVVLTLQPCSASSLPFRILFTPSSGELPLESLLPPRDLRVTFIESERKPLVEWSAAADGLEWWRSVTGFLVLRDGVEIGKTTTPGFLDSTADRGKAYLYCVRALGPKSHATAPVPFSAPAPKDAYLDGWSIFQWSQKPGFPVKRRSVAGGPLSVSGRRFDRGLGTLAPSRLDFKLDGAYAQFEARSGVDDAARFQGSVVFVVEVDGTERFRSPVLRGGDNDIQVRVPIAGGQVLSLIVEDARDGAESDFADWADARVIVGGK